MSAALSQKKQAEGEECMRAAAKALKTSAMSFKFRPDWETACAEYEKAVTCARRPARRRGAAGRGRPGHALLRPIHCAWHLCGGAEVGAELIMYVLGCCWKPRPRILSLYASSSSTKTPHRPAPHTPAKFYGSTDDKQITSQKKQSQLCESAQWCSLATA